MKSVFEKFCEEIKLPKSSDFDDFKIVKAALVKANLFAIDFENPTTISFAAMKQFLNQIARNFKYKVKFNLNVLAPIYDPGEIRKYLHWIIDCYLEQPPLADLVKAAIVNVDGEGLVKLAFTNVVTEQSFQTIEKTVQRIMYKLGFKKIGFSSWIKKDQNILAAARAAVLNEAKMYSEPDRGLAKIARTNGSSYAKTTIKDIYRSEQYNKVSITARVFNVTSRKTRTDKTVFVFSITDYTEAVFVKMFAATPMKTSELEQIRIDDYVTVNGSVQLDTYSRQKTVFATSINVVKTTAPPRLDEASEKRVELAFKTKMSTMDGICSPQEIVDRARKWGHKAFAVIDDGSVQSFPDFHHAVKDSGIKAIYGTSLNLADAKVNAIYRPRNQKLIADEYVVLDLETTGLSPEFDDIIEFGAVIIREEKIVNREQFFIKPSMRIPKAVTKLTGITNEMVADGLAEDEAIRRIGTFIGTRTIVAHNAVFDSTFLQTKARKYKLQQFTNTVIDSLVTARIVFPDAKRFRLERIARKYNVTYDPDVAHRAHYDAKVLSDVFTRMLYDLQKLKITTHNDLFNYSEPHLHAKAFKYSMSILAKNQLGLKQLFRLVSRALTTNFHGEPLVFTRDLAGQDNLMRGSGGIKSKLFDLIFTGSKAQIETEIARYDYIEICPPQAFVHKIADGFTMDNLHTMLRFIINTARQQNKLVVATGDVHYLDKREKIYHEIYINAKGLGGVRHNLFEYDKARRHYPDLHLLTTNEMLDQFSFLNDRALAYEIVVTNTNALADQISPVQIIKANLHTPTMPNAAQQLEELVYRTARAKYGMPLPEVVASRIKRELEPIKKYGFAIIYWLSHLLVTKSLRDGYLVGSRGSVGSSFVAYMADITEVNPLDPHYLCATCKYTEFPANVTLNSGYDLKAKICPQCKATLLKDGQRIPFETFLGFNADKVPDIDLNFSGDYQHTIHNEVKKLFGASHSFRAGTISTVATKTAYGYVKAWAEDNEKMISNAFTDFLTQKVAGTKRTTGQHPGGIIVIPKAMDVEDFTPINFPANDKNATWKTTHFDFHAIHNNVLKLDLLGHDDPTAIRYLERLTGVNAKRDIPFYDPQVISLFSSPVALGITADDIEGETTGVMGIPEFGTTFVRRMLHSAKVASFSDLIAVSGLSHGTNVWTKNADLVIKEQGKSLSEVISCRDNIMTDLIAKGITDSLAFQVMEQVRKGHGITTAQEKILKQHAVADWYIESLKKIKYMFPKAHATAYVMMAWRIAWFKLYHPLAYYATFFTTRADVFDVETVTEGKAATLKRLKELKARRNERNGDALSNKESALIPILELVNEAFARQIKISNISLVKSRTKHWIIDNNVLIPPFVAIDGLGETVAASIVSARKEEMFTSIEDLKARTIINSPALGKLRELGVLSDLSEKNQMSLDFNV